MDKRPVGKRIEVKQSLIDYISTHVNVTYHVDLNREYTSHQRIVLLNRGEYIIPNADWSIYFYSIQPPKPPGRDPFPTDGILLGSAGVRMHQIAGGLYRITPDIKEYRDVDPGATLEIPVKMSAWFASHSDVFPNWYVAAPNMKAKVIESTAREDYGFIAPFVTEKQYHRLSEDVYEPYTTEQRYHLASVSSVGDKKLEKLMVPSPLIFERFSYQDMIVDTKDWTIVAESKEFHDEAIFLSGECLVCNLWNYALG